MFSGKTIFNTSEDFDEFDDFDDYDDCHDSDSSYSIESNYSSSCMLALALFFSIQQAIPIPKITVKMTVQKRIMITRVLALALSEMRAVTSRTLHSGIFLHFI